MASFLDNTQFKRVLKGLKQYIDSGINTLSNQKVDKKDGADLFNDFQKEQLLNGGEFIQGASITSSSDNTTYTIFITGFGLSSLTEGMKLTIIPTATNENNPELNVRFDNGAETFPICIPKNSNLREIVNCPAGIFQPNVPISLLLTRRINGENIQDDELVWVIINGLVEVNLNSTQNSLTNGIVQLENGGTSSSNPTEGLRNLGFYGIHCGSNASNISATGWANKIDIPLNQFVKTKGINEAGYFEIKEENNSSLKIIKDGLFLVSGSVYFGNSNENATTEVSRGIYIDVRMGSDGSETIEVANTVHKIRGASSGAYSIAPKIIHIPSDGRIYLKFKSSSTNDIVYSNNVATYLTVIRLGDIDS